MADNNMDEMRAKIAKETGVSVELLTGEDEETCRKQAEAVLKLLELAKGSASGAKDIDIDQIREKVSKETGVPVELLTGEDEETCRKQAEAIMKMAKDGKKPTGAYGEEESFKSFAQRLFSKNK